MKAIMVMFDSLNRHFLPNYGCKWTKMPNFERLGRKAITFDSFYGGSMPCMPARRELHTGRYNFLHTPWSPMQPFDDSIITRMKKHGIYTHICTDHFHYLEDGGSCYLTKFDSHEIIRGQQGDPWKGKVKWPDFPETLSKRKGGENWRHDWINREFLTEENLMPQAKTFEAGLKFLEKNSNEDNWFLQIETFDPHEPFYTQNKYKELYSHEYCGKNLDWPDYGKNEYGEDATNHVKYEYAALMSMCDNYLGKILDFMDKEDMWKDTLLIVNTDHGFMLGEKEFMGKNIQPFYEEIIHTPFFIHDPRNPFPGERRKGLAQTIDIVPTLADFFNINPPDFMDGKNLVPIIKEDLSIRKGAMFGIFGGHVNITDGRYVYMHGPIQKNNEPLFNYTLMPCHMNMQFKLEELRNIELSNGFTFTKGVKLLKISGKAIVNPYWQGNLLFDLKNDPHQENPIKNKELQKMMVYLLRDLMLKNEAPKEQFLRLGIPEIGKIKDEDIDRYNQSYIKSLNSFHFSEEKVILAINIYLDILKQENRGDFEKILLSLDRNINQDEILTIIGNHINSPHQEILLRLIKSYL